MIKTSQLLQESKRLRYTNSSRSRDGHVVSLFTKMRLTLVVVVFSFLLSAVHSRYFLEKKVLNGYDYRTEYFVQQVLKQNAII